MTNEEGGTDASIKEETVRQSFYASGWRAGYHAAMLNIQSYIDVERAKVNVK